MSNHSQKELAAASDQLRADFEAAMQQFAGGDPEDRSTYRAFCMGALMCALTLRDFVERQECALLPHMTPEDCSSAYFEAARGVINAH
jgi:hypothetical protein